MERASPESHAYAEIQVRNTEAHGIGGRRQVVDPKIVTLAGRQTKRLGNCLDNRVPFQGGSRRQGM